MKRIIPVLSVLLLVGCTATDPRYIAQRQSAVLASAEVTCSEMSPADRARNYMNCLNRAVHGSGYWGQGVIVVAASDGSPRIVEATDHSGLLDNVNSIALGGSGGR